MKNIVLLFSLFCARAAAQTSIPLYPDLPGPKLVAFFPAREKATGTAMLVIPGGAYGFLAVPQEGENIAQALAAKGITVFVLYYRLPKGEGMVPLTDARRAMALIRQRAAEWQLDTARVGVIGFSAGGHLAAMLETHASQPIERPDFAALYYPVITMRGPLAHAGSKRNLLGEGPRAQAEVFFSAEEQASAQCPPTYISATEDDALVDAENSIRFYLALKNKGVKAELHIYPSGKHGFILRQDTAVWLGPLLNWLKNDL